MTRASRRLWGEDSIDLWSQSIDIVVNSSSQAACIHPIDVSIKLIILLLLESIHCIHILSINPLYPCPYQCTHQLFIYLNNDHTHYSPIDPSIHPSIHHPSFHHSSTSLSSIYHRLSIHLSSSSWSFIYPSIMVTSLSSLSTTNRTLSPEDIQPVNDPSEVDAALIGVYSTYFPFIIHRWCWKKH